MKAYIFALTDIHKDYFTIKAENEKEALKKIKWAIENGPTLEPECFVETKLTSFSETNISKQEDIGIKFDKYMEGVDEYEE